MLIFLGEISMIILMPHRAGDFSSLTGLEGKSAVKKSIERLYDGTFWSPSCHVTMPKFTIEHSADNFIDAQKRLGLSDVFDADRANFENLTPLEGIYLADARHKTYIAVDENGVEAAAATSYSISLRMLPMSVNINKPFMFIFRHDSTGVNLFMGRVVKPSAE